MLIHMHMNENNHMEFKNVTLQMKIMVEMYLFQSFLEIDAIGQVGLLWLQTFLFT